MDKLLSLPNLATAVVVYLLTLAIYRLTLHPLARFPGPKLAAITRYYEAYFDVILQGQYTFKIEEMHKRYGPIVRISPYELHVHDPAFYDTLYRQEAHYDKYDWAVNAMAATGASIFTPSHDLHKARRQPIAPFFSKAKVASRQDLIRRHLNKLVHRLTKYVEAGTTLNFGAAITAFARDVANDFILNKSYNSLEREDFDATMLITSQAAGNIWRLTKFVRWVAPTMHKIPIPWIQKVASEDMIYFFNFVKETQNDTRKLMAEATSSDNSTTTRTIVHDILDSKLPPSEKTFKRVYQEVSLVTGAGFDTTAGTLRMISFHIFSDIEILKRMRAELASIDYTADNPPDVKRLEQLPYLTAIITEGLRMTPAIATRTSRVARHTDLMYDQWRIPAGTPVGMTVLLLHHDESIYPEPKSFKPDRWLNTDGTLKKNTQLFAPFSKGTRVCLGMHLAWAELYIAVAELVYRFDFSFPNCTAEDFEAVSDQFGIGTRGKGNLEAAVTMSQA